MCAWPFIVNRQFNLVNITWTISDWVRPSTKMWTFWRSLWVLLLSVSVENGLGFACNSGTLGLEDLRIQDSQLTAQSYYESLSIGGGKSVDTEPKCARLNKNNCAWCAPRGSGQYLQVDLRRDFNITGIATQGFEALSDYYVKRYIVSHSRNGLKWSTFPVMTGNHDGRSVVTHTFRSPVYARYIRVYPVTYRYRICMRMELYGCTKLASSALSTTPSSTTLSGANNAIPENVPPTTRIRAASSTEKPIASSALSTIPSATTLSGAKNETPKNVLPTTRTTAAPSTEKPTTSHSASECNTALGLQDLRIQNSQLTAQSYYESLSIGGGKSVDTEPKCARLNKNNCAWCAPRGNGQYLQVDLRRDFVITGIATQGFEALSDYYVKRYKVSHSRNGHTWSIFPELMRGNHDGRSVVRHNFISPVYARYIRVYPMAYRYRICMRMELYGCLNPSSALSTTPSPTTNTTPKNVPPTTRTGAASSKERPMTIHSTTASSALSTTPSSTTSAGNNIPENVPPTTRTTAASSTEKPMISHSASECNTALGVEDLRINDSQLTAQSNYESLSIGGGKSVDTEPKCARLNHKSCAWCAPRGNGQYLQVDLRGDFTITGIATQGFEALSDYYVRRYKVSHSKDGYTWSTSPVALRGNHDGRSVVRHNFSSPKYARYIRVYPVAYKYRICMRMELYGCSNTESSALSTTPSSTTLSVFNNTISGNLLPTTSATAALSTETSTGQPVGSGEVLTTTSKAEGTQQSGEHALQTGNAATDMVKDSSRKRSSKTVMIALIVVALALVIIICLLVAWLRLRGRKRSYRYSSTKMEVQLL